MSSDILSTFEENLFIPSPVDKLHDPRLLPYGVDIYCKREDLIHSIVSGNKWRKLKYNLEYFFDQNFSGIISFGGAYSNHLYALAHICAKFDIPLVSLIRGDGYDENNSTLSYIKSKGHKMIFLSRTEYRLKENGFTFLKVKQNLPNYLVISEGGSSKYATKGIIEMCEEIDFAFFDHIYLPAGTGATAQGVLQFMASNQLKSHLHIVSVLKGDFIANETKAIISPDDYKNYTVHLDYHWGGYAKRPKVLEDFKSSFEYYTGHPLDLIYNAKSAYAMYDMIQNGQIKRGEKILFINTGGRR